MVLFGVSCVFTAGGYAAEIEAQWFKQVAQGRGHGGPGPEIAEPGLGFAECARGV